MVVFPVFPAFSFNKLKYDFYCAPLGSTFALTTSSCLPIRVQPLRDCAEPATGAPLYVYLLLLFLLLPVVLHRSYCSSRGQTSN